MPKAKKYYHLFCLQNNDYMHSGRNSESKKELKEEFLSYISVDFDDDEELGYKHYNKLSIDELVDMWEMEIHTTNKKISEN